MSDIIYRLSKWLAGGGINASWSNGVLARHYDIINQMFANRLSLDSLANNDRLLCVCLQMLIRNPWLTWPTAGGLYCVWPIPIRFEFKSRTLVRQMWLGKNSSSIVIDNRLPIPLWKTVLVGIDFWWRRQTYVTTAKNPFTKPILHYKFRSSLIQY